MKKCTFKRIIAYSIMAMFIFSIPCTIIATPQAVYAPGDTVESLIVDRRIIIPYHGLNRTMPVLSFNDYTYISARDLANSLGCGIEFRNDVVLFTQPPEENFVIKSDNMALNIGKAVIEEYFNDKITDKTQYYATMGVRGYDHFKVYFVYAKFNVADNLSPEEQLSSLLTDFDVMITINPYNGEILAIRTSNGRLMQGGTWYQQDE